MGSSESHAGNLHPEAVASLSRAVVCDCAPDELPLLSSVLRSYRNNPESLRADKGAHDDMLGFGVQEIASFLTPVIVALGDSAITFLLDIARDTAREELKAAIRTFLESPKRSDDSAAGNSTVGLPLSKEEAQRLRTLIANRANDLHIPDEKAQLLVDSFLAYIAFGTEAN